MIPERLVLEREKNSELIQQHLARYEFAKAFVPGKRVLDVACGSGYGSAMLKQTGAAKVVGLDISAEAIAYAQTHFHGEGIDFTPGDAENLSAYSGFEVIVSFETIEHLLRPEKFLRQVTQALAPQGKLIISSPCRATENGTAELQNPHHFQEWTLAEFQHLLGQYFRDIRVYGQYNFEKKWFPYSRTLQRAVFRAVFPADFRALNQYPVLDKVPGNRAFQFDLVYTVCVCAV